MFQTTNQVWNGMGRGFREGNGLRLTNKNWEHRSMVGDDWEILGKS